MGSSRRGDAILPAAQVHLLTYGAGVAHEGIETRFEHQVQAFFSDAALKIRTSLQFDQLIR